jgi:DNA topoisomerase-1
MAPSRFIPLVLAFAVAAAPFARACEDLLDEARTSEEIAADAGLNYLSLPAPGYLRVRDGKRFRYLTESGKEVRDAETLARIQALGIPPAHEDVWISVDPKSHIQAIGSDSRGRRQYRYHPEWADAKKSVKFSRMVRFGGAIPDTREAIEAALASKGLGREKVEAAIVEIMDETSIRVGNEKYAEENGSFGLTTFRKSHVKVRGDRVVFTFKGKSSVEHEIAIENAKVASVVKALLELPGDRLFQYVDAMKRVHAIDSAQVNAYLRDVSGGRFSAKDFRTWAGTATAARKLMELGPPSSDKALKANLKAAIEAASERLGNTPAICESSYIHPKVLAAYRAAFESGSKDFETMAARALESKSAGWTAEERFVLELLTAK